MTTTKGLTRDAGWEAGVRRTVPVPLEVVWDFLLTDGLPIWLGSTELRREPGSRYRTAEGTGGEVRTFHDNRRIRLTWRPERWSHDSTVQLTVLPAARGTTIAFHHDRLADAGEREAMLQRWADVLDRIGRALTATE